MRWEKLRMRGKTYVVIRSAVISGIFLFFVINAGFWFWTGNPVRSAFFFIFPALGAAAGLVHWSVNESRFAEFLEGKKLRAAARAKR